MLWMHPSLQIIKALQNKPCRIIVDCDPKKDFPNSVTDVLPGRGGDIGSEPSITEEEPKTPEKKESKTATGSDYKREKEKEFLTN
ncbi:hypothetical protein ES708_27647 [subsurface metagenome]